MSWLSGIAGKAEAFLNQMDQAASSGLQDAGIKTPQKASLSQTFINEPPTRQVNTSIPYEPTVNATSTNQGAAVAQLLVGSASASSLLMKQSSNPIPAHTSTPKHKPSSPTPSSQFSSGTKEKVTTDDTLFEFLNTSSKSKDVSRPKTSTGYIRKTSSQRITHLSTMPRNQSSPVLSQPSVTSVSGESGDFVRGEEMEVSKKDVEEAKGRTQGTPIVMATMDSDELQQDDHVTGSIEEVDSSQIIHQDESPPPLNKNTNTVNESRYVEQPLLSVYQDNNSDIDPAETKVDVPAEQIEGMFKPVEDDSRVQAEVADLKQAISNYELENKLLKREVASLNEELGSVMNTLNGREESVAHYESEIHALREQASRTDHMIRQLRSHDEDLQASLEARDSQIQVLRTRFSEADKMVEGQQQQLAALSTEKERFLQDANLSSTAHSHALDSLKAQLTQSQFLLEQECNSNEAKRQEFSERESQLQSELSQVSEALTEQQRHVSLKQAKCIELQTKLQSVYTEQQLARKEHEDYRLRAAGILQTKEKLINSLQSGVGGAMGVADAAKLEEMRLEKEYSQTQLHTAFQHIESLKADIQEADDRHSLELESLVEQVRVCESVLSDERRQHAFTQGEVTRLNQELEDCKDSLLREKSTTTELLKRNESELSPPKAQLSSSLSPSGIEQESRLRELTESLIQKQTSLETLSTEKNSLNLQLQRLQSQLAEAQKSQTVKTQTALVMNGFEQTDTYNDSTRIRPMASVLSSLENAPSDSRLHNVKKAVNVVDKFSIRLGVFLRRYPHARLFALLYMVLLHVWVMVVLLTYTPETHDLNGPSYHQL